ncbi:alkaline phosphatase [Fimicolochytrium jonesii]|uniref:alkaline phosphatase n=1 Tax=Fimicolochytrium jonesii TaxID=1396493 RepID=UPI0022FF209B|nr:alkaline phosphatase [Fimicolochytrium jonesii]KAI8823967.1 alkaline phosphatase [Fimicolochytrium jonesii]
MADNEAPSPTDPLLGRAQDTHPATTTENRRNKHRKIIAITFASAFVLLLVATVGGIWVAKRKGRNGGSGKRNVILMVSDGFGPASETLARQYYQYTENVPFDTKLPLDTILVGSSRTQSSDSFVTDSAAGATAFACGIKTYNGAIAVNTEQKPCGTVLEAAKEQGYLTGMVVTSRITHATPACFASHSDSRNLEDDIALDEIGNYTLGRRADLMFGGGSCFFRPKLDTRSCRADSIDAFAIARDIGWHVGAQDRTLFDALDPTSIPLPYLNLFADDHMAYEIDRDHTLEPSLKEMAEKALDILTYASKDTKGFFLMIEGSRIDMAAHNNDPAAHIHEILAYQETIKTVKKYVAEHPDTVMISVSDHETGGLSVGRQLDPHQYPVYDWNPKALVGAKKSIEVLTPQIASFPERKLPLRRIWVNNTILANTLGVHDATLEEIDSLAVRGTAEVDILMSLGEILSRRAGLGWATHGHSAVDVNLYAYGLNADQLRGNHENTEIGKFIIRQLELDVEKITAKLNRRQEAIHGHEEGV